MKPYQWTLLLLLHHYLEGNVSGWWCWGMLVFSAVTLHYKPALLAWQWKAKYYGSDTLCV